MRGPRRSASRPHDATPREASSNDRRAAESMNVVVDSTGTDARATNRRMSLTTASERSTRRADADETKGSRGITESDRSVVCAVD